MGAAIESKSVSAAKEHFGLPSKEERLPRHGLPAWDGGRMDARLVRVKEMDTQSGLSLRVLNVVYDERFSGPPSRILQVAGPLKREGVESIVVTRRGDPTFPRLLNEADIEHVEIALVRARRSFSPLEHFRFVKGFWPNVARLRMLIRSYRVSVVHNNGALHFQAPLAAYLERVPLVWHLNDVHVPTGARRFLPRVVLRLADVVAVASRAVADYYFDAPPESDQRMAVLYPPADVERFNPRVDGTVIRSELGIDSTAPIIATVANLCPGKGLEYLLQAAAEIRRVRPDARFLIAGAPLKNRDGYRRALLRLCGELRLNRHVMFLGARGDVDRIFAAADVCLHPSEREAAPMAVMEASASGVPVVACDVGGTREIVEEGVTGFLVPPRAPEQMALKMLALLGSPCQAAAMGRSGAQHILRSEFVLLPIAPHATRRWRRARN